MSAPVAHEEELAGRRRLNWRVIVVRTLLGLLALLLAMTAWGLVAGSHVTGGVPHRAPAPRPTISGDMQH